MKRSKYIKAYNLDSLALEIDKYLDAGHSISGSTFPAGEGYAILIILSVSGRDVKEE